MILTASGSSGLVFCSMSPRRGLSGVFLVIGLRSWVWGRKPQRPVPLSRHVRSEVHDVRATSLETVRCSGSGGVCRLLVSCRMSAPGSGVESSPSSALSLTLGFVNLYKSSFLPGGRSPTLASSPCGRTAGRGSRRAGPEGGWVPPPGSTWSFLLGHPWSLCT